MVYLYSVDREDKQAYAFEILKHGGGDEQEIQNLKLSKNSSKRSGGGGDKSRAMKISKKAKKAMKKAQEAAKEEKYEIRKINNIELLEDKVSGKRHIYVLEETNNLLLPRGMLSGFVIYSKNFEILRVFTFDFQNQDVKLVHRYFRNNFEAIVPINDRFYLLFMIDSCVILFDSYCSQVYKFLKLGAEVGTFMELVKRSQVLQTYKRKCYFEEGKIAEVLPGQKQIFQKYNLGLVKI